jgi:pantoate ligase / CMP/dCMP kinase
MSLAELEQSIRGRDFKDSTRAISPLQQAADAIELITDDLTIEGVVDHIIALYRTRQSAGIPDQVLT